MQPTFLSILQQAKKEGKKLLAFLVDPDKTGHLDLVFTHARKPDVVLVGGSLLGKSNTEETVLRIKKIYPGPVIIFPGDFSQATPHADGILFLSLISGRNPDMLIGRHVLHAPMIKASGLETIPCGYILVNAGTPTSVEYMSNTVPLPANKPDLAVATAMAGEMLGLQCIYMESGSGAEQEVSTEMIRRVSENIGIPLIIGGGVRNKIQMENAFNAGATLVVIGTALEQNPQETLEWI